MPQGPADLLTSGADDDPIQVASRRRRWRRLAAIGAGALVVAALATGRLGAGFGGDENTGGPLPAEAENSVVVLDPGTEESASIDLPDEPLVLRIDCYGPGAVLARMDGRSFLQARCTAGSVHTVTRRIDSNRAASPGDTLFSVSTVQSLSGDLHWRVTVY